MAALACFLALAAILWSENSPKSESESLSLSAVILLLLLLLEVEVPRADVLGKGFAVADFFGPATFPRCCLSAEEDEEDPIAAAATAVIPLFDEEDLVVFLDFEDFEDFEEEDEGAALGAGASLSSSEAAVEALRDRVDLREEDGFDFDDNFFFLEEEEEDEEDFLLDEARSPFLSLPLPPPSKEEEDAEDEGLLLRGDPPPDPDDLERTLLREDFCDPWDSAPAEESESSSSLSSCLLYTSDAADE